MSRHRYKNIKGYIDLNPKIGNSVEAISFNQLKVNNAIDFKNGTYWHCFGG